MTEHNPTKATLRFWTLGAGTHDRRQALRFELDGGLVKIHALDAAYDDMLKTLVEEGIYSHELRRSATVDDGIDFLKAAEAMLVNSSYWYCEWDAPQS